MNEGKIISESENIINSQGSDQKERNSSALLKDAKEEFYFFVIPFALFTAGAYQYGYWSTFGINIFPYLNITEIITSVIPPLIFLISYSFFGRRLGTYLDEKYPINLFDGESKKTLSLKNIYIIVSIILMCLIFNYFVIFKWIFILVLLIPFIFSYIYSAFYDSPVGPKIFQKILFSSIFLPILAFGEAKIDSLSIKYDSTFEEVKLESFKSLSITSTQIPLKYLGQAGDYYFFLTYDNNEKLIVSKNEMNGLYLKKPSNKKIKLVGFP